MLIVEYRITLPLTNEEYKRGQLYTVAEMSKNVTGNSEGIEVVRTENFSNVAIFGDHLTSGRYTLKKYYIHSKVPKYIRILAPKKAFILNEDSWNAFPYCRTILKSELMEDNFFIKIETHHIDDDRGSLPNVHELPESVLSKRDVIYINIANDEIRPSDYKVEHDPSIFLSKKTGRGQLKDDWVSTVTPVMTCYKLVSVYFKYFGLQSRVEHFIQSFERRLFTTFNRQLFCGIDEWYDLSMDAILEIDNQTNIILNELRQQSSSNSVFDSNE